MIYQYMSRTASTNVEMRLVTMGQLHKLLDEYFGQIESGV